MREVEEEHVRLQLQGERTASARRGLAHDLETPVVLEQAPEPRGGWGGRRRSRLDDVGWLGHRAPA